MLYFIISTVITAVPIFAEPLRTAAVFFTWLFNLYLLCAKIVFPRFVMARHRFTIDMGEPVRYEFFLRWGPLMLYLILAEFIFIPDARLVLTVYYLVDLLVLVICPVLRMLVPKVKGYLQIRRVCREHGYRVTGSFFRFLFPDDKTPAPELTIETPAEIFSVQVLGNSAQPLVYSFTRGQNYTVRKINRYMAKYIYELEKEKDCLALRMIHKLFFGKEKEKTLAAPLEGVTNILLFAPDFAYCKAEGKDGPVEVGNTMHGYSVYNVRRFVRGRLAVAHTHTPTAEEGASLGNAMHGTV